MKIGLISPLWKKLPPEKYGGTELVVYDLACALTEKGHEVSVFASGDSNLPCKLIPVVEKNLYEMLGQFKWDFYDYDILQTEKVGKMNNEFDILHNHNGFIPLTITPLIKTPMLTTIHSSLPPEPAVLREAFKDRFYISISNAQRELAPELNWIATVYHGIDVKKYPFSGEKGEYLVFLGTFSPHKGPDIAIEISKKSGIPIILAGEIRKEFEEFYREKILSQQDGRQIKVFGELTFQEKAELLKNALALIFPVRWKEAFGLVMIESMACGTPVIAFRKGSTQEVVEHGITGFLVGSVDEACEALKKIEKIDRNLCRKTVQQKFSRDTMAESYLKIYKMLEEDR
ncbi:glycosyltransferase family 4 protein [Thermodesulfovibrio sp. 3907-1M]|uniref:Glycosyltransferase family 4 protein n=1 Tax=Thermodesulfovibrio autotrophicus TaxID=3118333 RepID=A0AAU8GTW3_9BACT